MLLVCQPTEHEGTHKDEETIITAPGRPLLLSCSGGNPSFMASSRAQCKKRTFHLSCNGITTTEMTDLFKNYERNYPANSVEPPLCASRARTLQDKRWNSCQHQRSDFSLAKSHPVCNDISTAAITKWLALPNLIY